MEPHFGIVAAIERLRSDARIVNPQKIIHLDKGVVLLALTGSGNLALSLGLVYVGKKTRLIVLAADGKHIMTDVLTTLGVFVGLLFVRFTRRR